MGTSKNPVVPANGHKGHAGPVSKFFKLLILPANLDPDPAQPLWLFAGETILGFLEVPPLLKSTIPPALQAACPTAFGHLFAGASHATRNPRYTLPLKMAELGIVVSEYSQLNLQESQSMGRKFPPFLKGDQGGFSLVKADAFVARSD